MNKSDPLKALSDPLRISLFELIKEGPKTTPELAEILEENRINLYHHLKMLEKAGLIISSYNSDRVKVYKVDTKEPKIQHHNQATTIMVSPDPKGNVETIILSPPSEDNKYKEFKSYIRQAAALCGKKLEKGQEILQVQVSTEEKSIFQEKAKRSSSVKKKRKMR